MTLKTLKELLQPYKEIDDYLAKIIWDGVKKEYPKDFFKGVNFKLRREEESFIQVKQLKQEAIKWIKELKVKSFVTNPNLTDKELANSIAFTIKWIEEFFNITEEDIEQPKARS